VTHEETTALVRRANASGFESIADYAVSLEGVLEEIERRAGWFMDRGSTDFSYEDISERLGLALQDLSVIRRKAHAALDTSLKKAA
jgi:hypothetical protein